jgi:hypothetical protein
LRSLGGVAGRHGLPLAECCPNKLERSGDILANERGIEPHYAVARSPERRVAPIVRSAAALVIATIDFDHQALRRSEEVYDVAADRNLPAKADTELPAAESFPKLGF